MDYARERLPLVTAAEDTMLEVKGVLEVRMAQGRGREAGVLVRALAADHAADGLEDDLQVADKGVVEHVPIV